MALEFFQKFSGIFQEFRGRMTIPTGSVETYQNKV